MCRGWLCFVVLSGWLACIGPARAQFDNDDILPPTPPWSGKTRALAVADDHPWVTPFELGDMAVSPNYTKTFAWFRKLVAASPKLKMVSIGTSLQGREIWMIIASADEAFGVDDLAKKPLVLAHAGIHSGEIDGKDAGMMLLRDMTVRGNRAKLLEKANFLFIPILNVDGHERASTTNRINQRGPQVMGWRTNGRNLNLNRDFTKVETRGVQALIRMINTYDPDLYLDLHVTDGVDYQYDITYGFTGPHGYSPAGATWLQAHFRPAVDKALLEAGHVPGPLIFPMGGDAYERGIVDWTAGPRFSNSYGDVRHLPSILIENHSLKPYDQRVLGTYIFLEAALRVAGEKGKALRDAIAKDRASRPKTIPLAFKPNPETTEMSLKSIAHRKVDSPISGGEVVQWLGKPQTETVTFIAMDIPAASVAAPSGYWVPADWADVIDKLRLHGLRMERLDAPKTVSGQLYRLQDVKLADQAFEGKVRMSFQHEAFDATREMPPGSVFIPMDQPLGDLAALLLEPGSADSLLQWGYFLEITQRTEYFEAYAMVPLAEKMLQADPALRQAFEKRLADDAEFAADQRARLYWFYERSPYMDQQWLIYPVLRQ